MAEVPDPTSLPGRAFAALGGLLFGASLGYFGYVLIGRGGLNAPAYSPHAAVLMPALWDVALFSLFALHHSLLARTGLKDALARLTSPALERSVYVWVASVLFVGVCAGWRPAGGLVWSWPWLEVPGVVLQLGGMLLSLAAAARIDVMDLAGIRQAFGWPRGPIRISTNGLYGLVRHPIYLGWLLMVWPAAMMSGGGLLFAAVSTAYLVAAIPFEERDLERTAPGYGEYCRRVPWKILPYIY